MIQLIKKQLDLLVTRITTCFSQIKLLVFLGLFSLAVLLCIIVNSATTPPEPTVTFESSVSSIQEDIPTVNLKVNLSASSSKTVTVDYSVIGGTASETSWGSGKDYTIAGRTLIFEPGTVTKNISISIVNDYINEADETIKIKLSNPSNAILGANTLHTFTVRDNDRKSIVDIVRDFGAAGDGFTDDTKAIQKAVNTVYKLGGGLIVFPPGEYLVTSVNLKENITYYGYGATIKRPDYQDKWTRTFTIEYSGNVDSEPLIIQGLTFDGNSQNQGSYQDYELQQAHLIFLMGNPEYPGKLRASIEDATFRNGVADGITVYTNVDVKVADVEAIDVFRGGFVLVGGNSSAEVYNLTTRGEVDATGIDIEVDGEGYGDTMRVEVKLENLNLIDGDFDISVSDGSTVSGNNIVSDDGPFYIYSEDSKMKFTNSKFKVGAADGYTNRILFPHDVTFENCEFYVTRQETGKPYDYFAVANIWWQHPGWKVFRNQRIVFNNCSFKVDSNIQKTDTTYAIYLQPDSPDNNNKLILNAAVISKEFDEALKRKE